jgi:PPM family protein phosphatase
MDQSSKETKVSVFARTDTGRRRSSNEDAFIVADLTTGRIGLGPDMVNHSVGERGSLMGVSDGMGGAAAGEVASEIAVKTIRESLMGLPEDYDVCGRLKKAAERANERIWRFSESNPKLKGMGATLTAVLVQQDTAFVAQVGDSRAYLARGNQIKQITKDQSLVQALIDAGALAPDQTSTIPHNVITQALGTGPTVDVEITSVDLCRDDVLIVCSDGLSNKITDAEMLAYVNGIPDLKVLCRTLIEVANQRGGEDNITIVTARFDGERLHSAAESSSISGSFHLLNESGVTSEPITDSYKQAVDSSCASTEDELEPITQVFNPINFRDPPAKKDR